MGERRRFERSSRRRPRAAVRPPRPARPPTARAPPASPPTPRTAPARSLARAPGSAGPAAAAPRSHARRSARRCAGRRRWRSCPPTPAHSSSASRATPRSARAPPARRGSARFQEPPRANPARPDRWRGGRSAAQAWNTNATAKPAAERMQQRPAPGQRISPTGGARRPCVAGMASPPARRHHRRERRATQPWHDILSCVSTPTPAATRSASSPAAARSLPHVAMAERRQLFLRDHDWVRRALMFEPRGHDCMSGSILYPPTRADCDIGVLFIEVSGCLPMCGHGSIGTVTVALEEGLVTPREPGRLAMETPAGRVGVEYRPGGRPHRTGPAVQRSRLPARGRGQDRGADLGRNRVRSRLWRQFLRDHRTAAELAGLDGMSAGDIQRLSPLVRARPRRCCRRPIPRIARIGGVSHVMWCDRRAPPARTRATRCSTATRRWTARLAAPARRRAWRSSPRRPAAVGERFIHESIIGTMFDCRVEGAARVGDHDAILPSVAGWARITGHNTIFVDDRDPLAHGFLLT